MYKAVIDIGNTQIKYALFKDSEMVMLQVSNDWDEDVIKLLKKGYKTDFAIISDVRYEDEPYKEFLDENFSWIKMNSKLSFPITLRYNSIDTLGSDRIALSCGAVELFPDKNVLIIGTGTCITLDFINEKGEYQGGSIHPGIKMRIRAMHEHTGKLPLVELDSEEFPNLIGANTRECILSGVYNGVIAEMQKSVENYQEQYQELKVVLSGGDWSVLAYHLKSEIFAHPNLVLFGLNRILEYNKHQI